MRFAFIDVEKASSPTPRPGSGSVAVEKHIWDSTAYRLPLTAYRLPLTAYRLPQYIVLGWLRLMTSSFKPEKK
jgi:hypothetical protein